MQTIHRSAIQDLSQVVDQFLSYLPKLIVRPQSHLTKVVVHFDMR